MKIGILGGTFDPIHLAHLKIGQTAMLQKDLNEIWFMPSKIPPHKNGNNISDEKIRFQMVELAVKDIPFFKASDFELLFPHTTYTVQTMERLKMIYPEHDFYFIMGGDSLFYFEKWVHPEKILENVCVLAVGRNQIAKNKMEERAEWLMAKLGGNIDILEMEDWDISSTKIRKMICSGEDVSNLLPEKVYHYIIDNKIYTHSR